MSTSYKSPALRAALLDLKRKHPNTKTSRQHIAYTQADLEAALRELLGVKPEAFEDWAIGRKTEQVRLLIEALQFAAPRHLPRAGKVLELHWRRSYWLQIQRLVCQQPAQHALRNHLGQVLSPWLDGNARYPAIQFWKQLLEAPTAEVFVWKIFREFAEQQPEATLDAFLRHAEIPIGSPLGQQVAIRLLLDGSARQLLNEPLERFKAIATLAREEQVRAFVNYFGKLRPSEWQPEFMQKIADPRLRPDRQLRQQVLDALKSPAAAALLEHYIRLSIELAFQGAEDHDRKVFWSQFAGEMTDEFKWIPLRAGQSPGAWHFKFRQFEVIEFAGIGAAYFYPPGWVANSRAVEPFPADYDLKEKIYNFFPPYIDRPDNRLLHKPDTEWRFRWAPWVKRMLSEKWSP